MAKSMLTPPAPDAFTGIGAHAGDSRTYKLGIPASAGDAESWLGAAISRPRLTRPNVKAKTTHRNAARIAAIRAGRNQN